MLAVLLLPAAAAQAGGIPPTSLDAGPEGVRDQTETHRFTATPLATRTVLTKSQTEGGRVLRASILDGRWGVPVVAYDGTSGGLSADGQTLVLTRVGETYPRRRTEFAVIDTTSMSIRDTIRLDGEWRFDAVSPHGRRVHLVDQLQAERAVGLPMTRAAGERGRRQFTLYAGSGRPFIQALHTPDGTSYRIPMPAKVIRHPRLWALRLAVQGNRVAVLHGDHVVASAAGRSRRASAGGGPPWLAVTVALTGLVLAATATRRVQARSRRSRELR
jgi:hypothetical protein